MVSLTIDGQKVDVSEDLTILEAAREIGIHIPTLCYHEALEPVGACRLCIVEVTSVGQSKTMASCVAPVANGLEVKTNSEKIIKMRKMILELLLARCPNIKIIRELAERMGVNETRFQKEDEDCFLCGLCVRACDEIVGVNAISFANRGTKNKVGPPFAQPSSVCISCGTCTTICPARTFKVEKVDNIPVVHRFHEDYQKEKCRVCGNYYLTSEFYVHD